MKKTIESNYRVEVHPRHHGDLGFAFISGMTRPEPETRRICEDIAQQIKRHVDGVGTARVVCDVEVVCEYCGWAWTEDGNAHNGGCCEKDLAVMDALQEASRQ